jgi:SpoVK/Ycf46/Vps4 family AAA+-type ATPase
MFEKHLNCIRHELQLDKLQTMATQTEGWSGSDIASLCREATMAPLRELVQQQQHGMEQATARGVTQADFDEAFRCVPPASDAHLQAYHQEQVQMGQGGTAGQGRDLGTPGSEYRY